ncbi:hypothetical protein [Ralstonia mojiangensis]|uniref:hypothetical protein n=1 Tax=Ralstonia mojiangensis TaxID=2953895 RepID=UPI0021B2D883|nr:hypothetical protein [Ralstonia mojiangensis]MCT7325024.1 hypothetical protein [Ralstonia mojiangensis]
MLYRNTLVFLQRLQQAATNGNFHYVSGETDFDGYVRLAKKFSTAYETELSRQTKLRRRRAGEASSTLYAVRLSIRADQDGKIPVHWILVASSGVGRVHEREKLKDMRERKTRLVAGSGRYQLVHDGRTWSWRLSHDAYNRYVERIHRIASLPPDRRRTAEIDGLLRDADAEKLLDELYSEPGFRLVRRQIGKLVSDLRREWTRLRPANGPKLSERTFLAYVRFLPNERCGDLSAVPDLSPQIDRRELFRIAFGCD